MSETGWRGSPEVWLDAAYEVLLTSGVDGVRIQSLADQLGLSRTSFYWFFKSREALLEALVERWRTKNTGNLVKQAAAYAETITEAMFNVADCWLDASLFDSRFENAIRSWALQSPALSEELGHVDEVRIVALRAMFERFGYDHDDADVRSRTAYLNQIGYITTKTRETVALRMQRMPNFVKIYTGVQPRPKDLERFYARHDFDPGRLAARTDP